MNKDEQIALGSLPFVILIGTGFAIVGHSEGPTVFGLSAFSLAIALAFLIQWIVFIPSYYFKTEKFYDLTGGLTYLTVTLVGVALTPRLDARSLLLAVLVSVWAIRLAYFLFNRIHKAGKDSRFDAVKTSFFRFLLAWTLQGLWVTFTVAAALAAITSPIKEPMGWISLVGLFVWIVGFSIETISDAQKTAFKADPNNQGAFIQSGLWAFSRHPNYFGEIILWVGVAIIALPVFRGWQFALLCSPILVALLITKISGIPILEKRADKTWGSQPEYEAYKKRVPVLIPRIPGKVKD